MNRAVSYGLRSLVPLSLLASACAPSAPDVDVDEIAGDEADALDGARFGVDISIWSGEITDAEVRCWYAGGVRHVIAGTQLERITRQQLDMAIAGGMTVDLYVYLHWNESMTAQVQHALEIAADYPQIGRLWLDAEEDTSLSRTAIEGKLTEALNACGDLECGIYTANWWWQPHMTGSTKFTNVPVWYAYYDLDPSMSTWSTQKFGGWVEPTAKQWQETYYCGIDVDKNTIFVDQPLPAAPPPLPADQPGVPAAPTGLYPDDLTKIETVYVRMLTATVPAATNYSFEVQSWNGSSWVTYTTYGATTNARKFNPALKNRVYRWRARAKDASGWGSWSDWALFEFGKATSFPPGAEPPPAEDPPEDPPAPEVPGAPTNLSPADGSTFPSGGVTLSCGAVSSADQYAFEIQYKNSSGAFTAYYTYSGSGSSRTFYPQYTGKDYRWRVRARTGGTWTPDSSWVGFHYGN